MNGASSCGRGALIYHPAIHVRTRDTAFVSHQYKAAVVFVSNWYEYLYLIMQAT